MIHDFNDLRSHIGHNIVCVRYGQGDECINVALECEDCGIILVDLNDGDTISKDIARDTVSHDGEEISIKWSIIDILDRAKERNITISDNQAKKILKKLVEDHDASYGINWSVIDNYLDDYLGDDYDNYLESLS